MAIRHIISPILLFFIPVPIPSATSRPLSGDLSIPTAHLVVSVISELLPLFYFDAVYLIYLFFSLNFADYKLFFLYISFDIPFVVFGK